MVVRYSKHWLGVNIASRFLPVLSVSAIALETLSNESLLDNPGIVEITTFPLTTIPSQWRDVSKGGGEEMPVNPSRFTVLRRTMS
jgi:hypothetical protein